jgi:hypothetical protein
MDWDWADHAVFLEDQVPAVPHFDPSVLFEDGDDFTQSI